MAFVLMSAELGLSLALVLVDGRGVAKSVSGFSGALSEAGEESDSPDPR
jgi:hypothetical protein